MEIFGSMIKVLGEKAVAVGIEKLKKSTEFKNTQAVLRQRLFREMAFNQEINRLPNITADQAIANFETKVLFELMDQPFLLEDLFPRDLDESTVQRIEAGLINQSIKSWISVLATEAELIEKLAFRLKTHELRRNLGINSGSKSYVRALVAALHWNLRRD